MSNPNVLGASMWSSYPVATSVTPAASILALQGGGLVQVLPQVFFAQAFPQTGNFYDQIPQNGTVPLVTYAVYPFYINNLFGIQTSAGSITATVKINGVNVTGLANLSVTTGPQNFTATANNLVGVGNGVTLVLSSNSGSAGLQFTMSGALTTT